MTLSPYAIRQHAESLSAFGDASVDRQLAIHVANGDFTTADADAIRRAVANSDAKLMRDLLDAI